MDPLRSAKSTVICLRSPSRGLLGVRSFSARSLGVGIGRRREQLGSRWNGRGLTTLKAEFCTWRKIGQAWRTGQTQTDSHTPDRI